MEEFSKWVLSNFTTGASLIVYTFVGALSLFAGSVGHFYRARLVPPPKRPPFSLGEFAYDQGASLLVALIMFWFSVNRSLPPWITAAAIAIVSFLGTAALIYIVRTARKKFGALLGAGADDGDAEEITDQKEAP
jgi:hypothetical protein